MEGLMAALRVVVATGIVVAAAAYTARYLGKRTSSCGGRGRRLLVLESLSLGQQRGLFAVRAGERVLIVGAGREGVTLLAEMGSREFASLQNPADPAGEPLGAIVTSASATGASATAAHATNATGDPLLGMLQGRLNDLRRRLGRDAGGGRSNGEAGWR
jgi:flagellar protein FliO/FliZ